MRAASQPLFRELRHATSMATPSTVSLSSRFFAPGLSSYISRLKVSASQRTFSTHTRKVRQQHVQQTHAAAPQSRTQLHVSEQATAIENLQKGLTDTLPCFAMRGEDVEVLGDPEVFHEHLLQMIKKARKRILISSLYIGTEQGELIEALRSALTNNPYLRLSVICDFLRSTREPYPKQSTATLLLPLIAEFPERVECWFYRSPNLKGVLEKIVPRRFDEGWGLWHCKWYVADDEIIFSGANLSQTYFTNRQDRYYHLRHQATLSSYIHSLFRLYTSYSYRLLPSRPPSANPHHTIPLAPDHPEQKAALVWPEPTIHPRAFTNHARATLTAFQRYWRQTVRRTRLAEDGQEKEMDTYLFPMIQAGVLGIKEEEEGLHRVFSAAENLSQQSGETGETAQSHRRGVVDLTSGYFGLYSKYKQQILYGGNRDESTAKAIYRIIAASPEANGFYKSKGVSALIPEGYTLLESRFDQEIDRSGRRKDITLSEWKRPGWTYHSKGVWLSQHAGPVEQEKQIPEVDTPFLTFIGSSNLSTRSLKLDVELSSLILTSSPTLRKAMGDEVQNLQRYAEPVGKETWALPERKVSWLATVLVALGVEGML